MRTAAGAAVTMIAAVGAAGADTVRAAGTTPTSSPPAGPSVVVNLGTRTLGRPVASGFIGLSTEFPAVRTYTGSNPRAINPVLVQLIRNLAPGQSPVLRIGGNSADSTWLRTAGVHWNPGLHNKITPSWLATTRALAVRTGGKLVLDLNLKLGSAAEIAAEAHAFLTGIGRNNIDALEVGNEPELYTTIPWYYRGAAKKPVYPRSRRFNFKAYAREMTRYAKLLSAEPLAGPATGSPSWLTKLPKVFAAERNLRIVTYHRYPLIRCFTHPGDPNYPTIPNLLAASSSRGLLKRGVGAEIALAHRHRATFRLDELGSVACKGQWGVSNTFASALWALDTLFSMVKAGVDGVNFHTLPQSAYRLFNFSQVDGHWQADVSPEYYGLLMFTRAAPPGSKLLNISMPTSPDVRAWAVRTPAGATNVVLINDSVTDAHNVLVGAPSPAPQAAVEQLTGPSVSATGGVTLAGQSFGTVTQTGQLTGAPQISDVAPEGGQYSITLGPASAVMMTLAPPSAH